MRLDHHVQEVAERRRKVCNSTRVVLEEVTEREHTERVHIDGTCTDTVCPQLLRRHVGGGPERGSGNRVVADLLSCSEVDDDRCIEPRDNDIFRLQVTVEYAVGVCVCEPCGNSAQQPRCCAPIDWPIGARERDPLHVGQDGEWDVGLEMLIHQRHHVVMLRQLPQQHQLTLEARQGAGVSRVPQHLDGDESPLSVPSTMDDRLCALADLRDNLVLRSLRRNDPFLHGTSLQSTAPALCS